MASNEDSWAFAIESVADQEKQDNLSIQQLAIIRYLRHCERHAGAQYKAICELREQVRAITNERDGAIARGEKAERERDQAHTLLLGLADDECIVSSNVLSPAEIVQARADGRMYVNPAGLGFVRVKRKEAPDGE